MENSPQIKPTKIVTNTSLRILRPKNKKTEKAQSALIAPSCHSFDDTDYQENIVMSVKELNSYSQSDIFALCYKFISSLLENRQRQQTYFDELKFQEPLVPNKTMKLSIKSFINEKSSNGQQITSLEDFNNFMYKKKISIEFIKSGLSLDSFGSIQYDSETIFQSQSLVLSKEIISQFFETPSPFIMIQSLCLILKYLWKTKTQLNKQNCVKILLVSIMLAFKLCYDQQVQGIGWYYASIVNIDSKQIPKLQAKFLRQLQFQTDVTKQQYFTVSTYLLGKQPN